MFNETRLLGQIPQYESRHIRHYFTDQEQFQVNQAELREETAIKKQLEDRLKEQLAGLGQSDRVELVSEALPELRHTLEDLRQTAVKYNVLCNRLSGRTHHIQTMAAQVPQVAPEFMAKFGYACDLIREFLHTDIFSNHIKLTDDIAISKQSHQLMQLASGSPGTELLNMHSAYKSPGDNTHFTRSIGGHSLGGQGNHQESTSALDDSTT